MADLMIAHPGCPVCGAKTWQEFGKFRYSRTMNQHRSAYLQSRMAVLFDVWMPDREEAEITAILCEQCGYATYRPRPTAAGIHAKYAFQRQSDPHQGVNQNRDAVRLDARRAETVEHRLTPLVSKKRLRVLDYGGGDGHQLLPWRHKRHECYLVDYNLHPAEGVRWLASRLEDINQNERFDVVLCSHVIEHQAEPKELVRRLVAHLEDEGIFYAEVPAELFGSIPIEMDPATHVGFFCHASLNVLLEECGLQILRSWRGVSTYNERVIHATWSIGKLRKTVEVPDYSRSIRQARRCLDPGIWDRVARFGHPVYVWGRVREQFPYHHPLRKRLRWWRRRIEGKIGRMSSAAEKHVLGSSAGK